MRNVASLPWKILLALAPVIPMVIVIWLMARRITHSDELEQRLHLTALASPFQHDLHTHPDYGLCAGVLAVDGDILIWIAPTLSLIYGATHVWLDVATATPAAHEEPGARIA